MSTNNNIINFFWIGKNLNKNGILTLKSFLDHGHDVHLWTYDKTISNMIDGVVLKDANEILNSSRVFAYNGRGDCLKGTYGGFSDIFRYYLINNIGGWYCDMDVTCLKNFSDIPDQDYILRPHVATTCVANIFKGKKDSDFLKYCIEQTEKVIDENNAIWIKPLDILKDCVLRFNFQKHIISKEYFGDENYDFLHKILEFPFKNNVVLPTHAIHWCNQAVTSGYWNKDIKNDWEKPTPCTLFSIFLKKHNIS